MVTAETPILQVRNLSVSVRTKFGGRARILHDVNWTLRAGGTLGIVGESGSGKTFTSLAILGLLPRTAEVDRGAILFNGRDIVQMSRDGMRHLRGRQLGMIPQDPYSSLDPSFPIASQLAEPLKLHMGLHGNALQQASISSLERVRIPSAKERLHQYPHQLSGGMRQRAVSAIALAGEPKVLIADEPTTALDVTTQAQYLLLLRELQRTTGVALILVSHDLLVVLHMCERIVVMYAGEVVEEGPMPEVFNHPSHPYTRALIGAVPTLDAKGRVESIAGQAPDPSEFVVGCRFAPRCRHAREICYASSPPLSTRSGVSHVARCFGTEPDGWLEP